MSVGSLSKFGADGVECRRELSSAIVMEGTLKSLEGLCVIGGTEKDDGGGAAPISNVDVRVGEEEGEETAILGKAIRDGRGMDTVSKASMKESGGSEETEGVG